MRRACMLVLRRSLFAARLILSACDQRRRNYDTVSSNAVSYDAAAAIRAATSPFAAIARAVGAVPGAERTRSTPAWPSAGFINIMSQGQERHADDARLSASSRAYTEIMGEAESMGRCRRDEEELPGAGGLNIT